MTEDDGNPYNPTSRAFAAALAAARLAERAEAEAAGAAPDPHPITGYHPAGPPENTKYFEVRDDGTHIPVLAVRLAPRTERERLILARGGFRGRAYVMVTNLNSSRSSHDPHGHHSARTMPEVHRHLEEHWDEVASGAVLDARHLRGEAPAPAATELG